MSTSVTNGHYRSGCESFLHFSDTRRLEVTRNGIAAYHSDYKIESRFTPLDPETRELIPEIKKFVEKYVQENCTEDHAQRIHILEKLPDSHVYFLVRAMHGGGGDLFTDEISKSMEKLAFAIEGKFFPGCALRMESSHLTEGHTYEPLSSANVFDHEP